MQKISFQTPDSVQQCNHRRCFTLRFVFPALVLLSSVHLAADDRPDTQRTIRVATFNVSLNRRNAGELREDLSKGDQQAEHVATILRIVRPDVVLLNEFDFDKSGAALKMFQRRYLEADHSNDNIAPLKYPYSFTALVNTGIPSGVDFDNDGKTDGPADALGFGWFSGQYGMVVLSRFPIDRDTARTFRQFLWKDLPSAAVPVDPHSGEPWYSPAAWDILPLSSKSHWDVPVIIDGRQLHLLAAHPTPPAFDGPEDRNGHRNHDEIRLWAEYISTGDKQWLRDDQGVTGGLPSGQSFVILGDLNADPVDGDSHNAAIRQLLRHPRVSTDFTPESRGAVAAATAQGQKNLRHTGSARYDTGDFSDRVVGNLRIDYVLPSSDLTIKQGAVFWPAPGEKDADIARCSDHHLVWLDLEWPVSK
jgi:endonuclease/exonuclease/phosphatase family metal-dependent hydrolase